MSNESSEKLSISKRLWDILGDGEEDTAIIEEVAALEASLAQAQADLETMRGALRDIADGNASVPDSILERGRAALTTYMWIYSQDRARIALPEYLKEQTDEPAD
jgi:hypothetical protein